VPYHDWGCIDETEMIQVASLFDKTALNIAVAICIRLYGIYIASCRMIADSLQLELENFSILSSKRSAVSLLKHLDCACAVQEMNPR